MRRILVPWVPVLLAACHPPVRSRAPGSTARGGASAWDPEKRIQAVRARLATTKGAEERAELAARLGWLLLQYRPGSGEAASAFGRALQIRPEPWAELGLALLAESNLRAVAAMAHYRGLLEALVSDRAGRAPATRCGLARFAARRLSALSERVTDLPGADRLQVVASRLACPVASVLLEQAILRQSMREGRRLDAVACPRTWRLGPRTGSLGIQDLPGRPTASGVRTWTPDCALSVSSPDGGRGVRAASFAFRLATARRLGIVVAASRHRAVFVDGVLWSGPRDLWRWPKGMEVLGGMFEAGDHVMSLVLPVGRGETRASAWLVDMDARGPARSVSFRDPAVVARSSGARPLGKASWARPIVPDSDRRPVAHLLYLWDLVDAGRLAEADRERRALLTSSFAVGILRALDRWSDPQGLSYEELRHRRGAVLRRIRRLLPRASEPVVRLARVLAESGRWQEALDTVRRAAEQGVVGPWQALKAEIFAERGWHDLAERQLAAVPRGQGSVRRDELELRLAELAGDADRALRIARRLSERDRSSDVLADRLLVMGRSREAEREYDRLLHLVGPRRDLLLGLARAAAGAGRRTEALRVLRRLVAQRRADADGRLLAADLLAASGARAQALSLLRAGLEWSPRKRALLRGLRLLGGSVLLDRFRVDGRRAAMDYLAKGGWKGRGPVYVVDRMVTWVLPSGATLELGHAVVHLRPGSDLGYWGQVRVREGATLLTLRVIKPDGRVILPKKPSDQEPWHLSGLEEGDFVELEYLEAFDPLWVPGGGFAGRRFFFQGFEAATMGSTYVLVSPRGMPIDVDARAGAPSPEVSQVGEWTVRTWRGRPSERLRRPVSAPPPVTYVPSVRVGTRASWRFVAGLVRQQVLEADRPSWALSSLAKRLCSRGAALEKVRRVWRWVGEHVEHAGTFRDSAAAVLVRHSGYRLNLVRALLRLCGLEPATLMVVPRHRETKVGPIGDPTPFRYPVLRVDAQRGSPIYLFPFLREMPVDFVPAMLRGALALEVDPRPGRMTRLPRALGRDRERLAAEVQFLPDGSLRARVREVLAGWTGILMHRELRRLGPEKFRKTLERLRVASLLPGAVLDGRIRFQWEPGRTAMVLSYRLRSARVARRTGRGLLLRVSLRPLRLARRYPADRGRRADLLVGSFPDFDLRARFVGPAGYVPAVRGRIQRVSGPFGSLEVRSAIRAGALVYELHRRVPFFRIRASRVPAFRDFARKLDELEVLEVRFQRARQVRRVR